ncbi:hypothetical protein NQ318_013725 [Aromia moschata]|uniref:Uncharacterized protein n=1 Tax=Aromia moschata TaxID=1265417 RepID=A0AAV8ZA14_9CUCU|nr:hypothetical protein NQ318_013725 [Aromia moschata]
MALASKTRYNSNTFGIAAGDSLTPVQQDTGIFPESHRNYVVYNMGRTEVYAKLKYGTKVMWHGVADEATIKPGETKELNNWGRPYYVTGCKIYNNTKERAVVQCVYAPNVFPLFADLEPGAFDELRNKMLKEVVAFGIKYVPYVGAGLSAMVKAFWPENKPNVWEQIQDKVEALVEKQVLNAIAGILSGDVKYFQERITVLSEEIENGGSPESLRVHYMNIAQDLVGFEKKFIFGSEFDNYKEINKYILPHFSTTVLMKISFYVIGMTQGSNIGLSNEDVRNIKLYGERTIQGNSGANKYIMDMYEDRLIDAYRTKVAEDLYDNMMNVRSYVGSQGMEYITIWNYLFANLSEEGLYNDVVVYSTFFGRQTGKMIAQAIPDVQVEPLTPSLTNGKRNKMTKVDFYMWRNQGGAARVGGMKVFFENGQNYTLGTTSGEVQTADFNGALLQKLEVYGGGAIDHLVFHFSNGQVKKIGEKANHNTHTVYELENHHIVGMFLATDNYSLGGQAANFCVSYKLNDK